MMRIHEPYDLSYSLKEKINLVVHIWPTVICFVDQQERILFELSFIVQLSLSHWFLTLYIYFV